MESSIRVGKTPDGRRVEVSRRIDAPRDRVWDLLVDTAQWPAWGPSITDVTSTDRRIRSGTTGEVRTVGGLWLSFEVTSCADYRWTWRVAGIPATGHRVEALNEGCKAVFEVPISVSVYVVVCGRALSNLAALA